MGKGIMGFLGLGSELEEEYELEELEEEVNSEASNSNKKSSGKANGNKSKLVDIRTASSRGASILIIKPKSYSEATEIVDALKASRIVVVNTTDLENKIAQRLLDFLGGAIYAIEGDIQDIERTVFVCTPPKVEVTNSLKTELATRGLFHWTKEE